MIHGIRCKKSPTLGKNVTIKILNIHILFTILPALI